MTTGDLELRRVRAAQNQVLFRQVNSQIDELNERLGSGDELSAHVCECLNRECGDRIALPHSEYERIRRDPAAFFVVPGHEVPEVEESLERTEGWVVVRKLGEGGELAIEFAGEDAEMRS